MRPWILVIVGAVLPLVSGASLGSIGTTEGKGTWAYPTAPTAFLLMSLLLAVSHLLVLVGYLEVARRTSGAAATLARLGALGTLLVAGCEIWSGLVARIDRDAGIITALNTGYGIATVCIAVGTVGAGLALQGTGSPLTAPVLVNGLFFVLVVPVRFLGGDALGIAGLTLWSLLYVWWGLRLREPARVGVPA